MMNAVYCISCYLDLISRGEVLWNEYQTICETEATGIFWQKVNEPVMIKFLEEKGFVITTEDSSGIIWVKSNGKKQLDAKHVLFCPHEDHLNEDCG